ncbi:MAG TPA: hypothetical protein VJK03_00640 [Candidatus Nanoarchaeia archaeon]|nr:hypothetical protein [Candidatus Nanoarchaeia archaeon]
MPYTIEMLVTHKPGVLNPEASVIQQSMREHFHCSLKNSRLKPRGFLVFQTSETKFLTDRQRFNL